MLYKNHSPEALAEQDRIQQELEAAEAKKPAKAPKKPANAPKKEKATKPANAPKKPAKAPKKVAAPTTAKLDKQTIKEKELLRTIKDYPNSDLAALRTVLKSTDKVLIPILDNLTTIGAIEQVEGKYTIPFKTVENWIDKYEPSTEKIDWTVRDWATSGKRSKFTGKRIYKVVSDNPRRKGTHGYNSFELLKDGMSFEEYKAAGGRNNDLQWDLDKGFVELK